MKGRERDTGKRGEMRERKRERDREIPLKIGSNKLSTIFAGLNTLKRLEIRRPGGPFVRRVAGERHEGLRRVIRTAKRETPGTQKRDEGSAGEDPRYYSCHRWLAYTLTRISGPDSKHATTAMAIECAPSNTPVDPTDISAMISRHAL